MMPSITHLWIGTECSAHRKSSRNPTIFYCTHAYIGAVEMVFWRCCARTHENWICCVQWIGEKSMQVIFPLHTLHSDRGGFFPEFFLRNVSNFFVHWIPLLKRRIQCVGSFCSPEFYPIFPFEQFPFQHSTNNVSSLQSFTLIYRSIRFRFQVWVRIVLVPNAKRTFRTRSSMQQINTGFFSHEFACVMKTATYSTCCTNMANYLKTSTMTENGLLEKKFNAMIKLIFFFKSKTKIFSNVLFQIFQQSQNFWSKIRIFQQYFLFFVSFFIRVKFFSKTWKSSRVTFNILRHLM